MAVIVAAFSVAIVVTTEFIVVGILPILARDLEISVSQAGQFVSWHAFAAAVVGSPLTILSSRIAPHRVLAVVLLLFALGNLAVVLVPEYPLIAAARVVQGAALPVFIATATAAVARLAAPGAAGRAIAGVNIGVVVATVFAVPAGVIMADMAGWSANFIALAALAGLAALTIAALFPRMSNAGLADMADQAAILLRPRFQAHLALSAILFVGMFAAYTYLAAFLEGVAGFESRQTSLALMGFGFAGLTGNWAAGLVVDRAPLAATAGVAAILTMALAASSLAGGHLWSLLPILGVWGAAHTAAFIICHVRTMLAAPQAPAFAGALNISVSNLGVALGALAGGWTIERFGLEAAGWGGASFATLTFVMALLLSMAANDDRNARVSKFTARAHSSRADPGGDPSKS
ncbi:MAG: MFS transporter [Rhodospirillaceae bacterium]|nr:MFS transporter [Rhodospirillaceae bacterium]